MTIRGNIAAIRAKFDDAITDYQRAAADQTAVDLALNESVYKLRRFQALDGHCYFYMISNPQKGRELHQQSDSTLRAMLADPNPSYDVQLAEAEWQNLSGAFCIRDNNFVKSGAVYRDMIRRLERLHQQPSPSVRIAERMTMTRSSAYTRLGICQMMLAKAPQELELSAKSL